MITFYYALSTSKTGTEGLFNDIADAVKACTDKGFSVGDVSNLGQLFARRPILKGTRRIGWITATPIIR